MISMKISRRPLNALVVKRLLSGQTSPKRSETEALRAPTLKTTSLPSGLIVTSLDNRSPITRIGVIVRAGARYEPQDQLGLSHTLRSMAGFSTKDSTVFGITRNIEYVGGSLTALTTRDDVIYVLENDGNYTDRNLKYLSDTVLQPAFKHWQIKDNLYRQKADLSYYRDSPQLVLIEALHSAAFRGGLRNSIYSPDFMIGKHSTDQLADYVDRHFVSNRTAIVGVGIEHNQLLERVDKWFSTMSRGDRGNSGQSKFVGGEARVDTNSDTTYVAVAAEGVGSKNQKDVLSLSLLQTILGTGPRVEFSDGSHTKLGEAVAKTTSEPFAVSAFNINYTDTGLFGITVAASAQDIHKAVKAAVTQLRASAKSISEEELKNAKHSLKATTLLAAEDQNVLVEELATQSLNAGQVVSLTDYEKAVDSITVQDITGLANKIVKSKGAMACVGKLQNAPYLEDLL
ncbi:unnamed protein product [Medioppia subpectinata]|uniref:Cytochrome b-c1 complex subunit 2, mitochondrial n=1 Tax=Medioppia subpectinata TaxID=1979941 RepID=A0A7R9KLY1_9ACAR|nr:unnamed protein product [Medioppia subpectinata]CAG2104811.1 unnamed protein product [Medioppia subpectinata]